MPGNGGLRQACGSLCPMSHLPGLWETRLASIMGGAVLLCPNQLRKQALLLFLSAQLLLPVLGGRDVRVSGTLSLWVGLASTPCGRGCLPHERVWRAGTTPASSPVSECCLLPTQNPGMPWAGGLTWPHCRCRGTGGFLSSLPAKPFLASEKGSDFCLFHWQLTTIWSSYRAWSPRRSPQAPRAPVSPAGSAHLCPSRGSLGCIACPLLFSGSPNGRP